MYYLCGSQKSYAFIDDEKSSLKGWIKEEKSV